MATMWKPLTITVLESVRVLDIVKVGVDQLRLLFSRPCLCQNAACCSVYYFERCFVGLRFRFVSKAIHASASHCLIPRSSFVLPELTIGLLGPGHAGVCDRETLVGLKQHEHQQRVNHVVTRMFDIRCPILCLPPALCRSQRFFLLSTGTASPALIFQKLVYIELDRR